MEKGWVKLYRRILENSFLMNDNNACLVFMKLLLIVGQEKGQWSGGRLQLAEIMNMNPNTLKDVIKRLQENGVILVESQKRYSIISVVNWSTYQNKPNGGEKKRTPRTLNPRQQMSFDESTPVNSKSVLTPDQTPLAQQIENEDLTPDLTPTRHPHDTHTTPLYKEKEENKNIISTNVEMAKPVYGNSEINDMFDFWEKTIGYPIQAKRQANRNACSNLIKKHTIEGLHKLINGVSQAHGDRYGPRISDFVELQTNLNQLMGWGKRRVVGNVEERGIRL